jgi:hypothetical protein
VSGDVYEGEFRNGVKVGTGKYIASNGVYEGEFKDGTRAPAEPLSRVTIR